MKFGLIATITSVLICTIPAFAGEPVVVSCKFENLPLMMLILRGGMGADDNTLQVGDNKPVTLGVGFGLSTAQYGAQEFVFSLRLPQTVTVSNNSSMNDYKAYSGECISSLPRW